MIMSPTFWMTFFVCLFLCGCGERSVRTPVLFGSIEQPENEDLSEDAGCVNNNPDNISCKIVQNFTNFIVDSFERDNVIDGTNDFGWHKIINDFGTVIDGNAGSNVDVQIYSDAQMGPASDGSKAIYHFGRQGYSVHNIYLITKTFDLSLYQGDTVVIEFDYLPIGLEVGEYLKLEICNDTPENCGVGSSLTVEGLNSNKWLPVFSSNGAGTGRNGFNHAPSDFITQKTVLFLEDFQKNEFIFRFNTRMNDGFIDNMMSLGMEDGVVIDNVRATAYDLVEGIEDEIDDPDDILDFDRL